MPSNIEENDQNINSIPTPKNGTDIAYHNSMSMSIDEMEAEIKESEAKRPAHQYIDQINKIVGKDTPRTNETKFYIHCLMTGVAPPKTSQINPEQVSKPTGN